MENPSLASWEGVLDNYLKAEHLEGKEGEFVAENVELKTKEDGKMQIVVSTAIKGVNYVFPLNYTNTKFVKEKCKTPKELLGKVMKWEKIKVRNPNNNQTQDGISIIDIK